MMELSIFGSMTKLNLVGKGKSAKSEKGKEANIAESFKSYSTEDVERGGARSQSSGEAPDEGKKSFRKFFGLNKFTSNNSASPESIKKESPNEIISTGNSDEEQLEARDKFEINDTTFYKVLRQSYYDEHLHQLNTFKKPINGLKSSNKREKKTTKSLKERKLIISSPQNFQRVENDFTLMLRKEAEQIGGTLKKSASLDDLLRDDDDFKDHFSKLNKEELTFSSVSDLRPHDQREDNFKTTDVFVNERCYGCGGFHSVYVVKSDNNNTSSNEDDKVAGNTYSSVDAEDLSSLNSELLKSINQVPKDRTGSPPEHKFPLVDDVEFRKKSENHTNRRSKTTDFDAGRRRQPSPISNPKDFSIQGIVAISNTERGKPILVKWKEEYILYENENFYRVVKKTKEKELLDSNVVIKSINYPKSKESKEVELKDSKGQIYTLHFQDLKQAKQFMENEKVQVYNNKSTVRKLLLGFFGRRSSREILEKKGIYKNEPIFGNTLRDIYLKSTTNSLVPSFIYQVINLLERPENIKSLGVYRTSGNLAIIQKIRFEVDNGRLNILSQYAKDPDVLTGSLKLFFRELKEPLISRDICDKLLDFAKIDPKQITSKEHQKIRSILIKNLHEANLETFVVIIRHLLEVIKYKDYNKMDAYNMAICWGPSMVFSVQNDDLSLTADLSKDIVTQSQDATRLVDFFLVYYDLYPAELVTLGKRQRPESISEKIHSLRRQDSKDSVGSFDSNKSQKKSASNLSLSIDEITKKLVEFIEPHISCEGLYRRSGSADKTSKIMKKLNKKKINELEKFKNEVHDLTDALKKYLKEQDSLIHEGTVEMVLRISSDSSHSCLEPNTRQKIINLIEDTPKKDTLIFLLRHLAKVLEYQEQSYNVPKNELINIWTGVLNNQKKSKANNEEFAKFLAVAVKVFNDNLPDIVRSSFNNNGGSPNRNESMDELIKEMTNQHRQAERDRNSRYDNVDSDVGEASILDDKTEQTKL